MPVSTVLVVSMPVIIAAKKSFKISLVKIRKFINSTARQVVMCEPLVTTSGKKNTPSTILLL